MQPKRYWQAAVRGSYSPVQDRGEPAGTGCFLRTGWFQSVGSASAVWDTEDGGCKAWLPYYFFPLFIPCRRDDSCALPWTIAHLRIFVSSKRSESLKVLHCLLSQPVKSAVPALCTTTLPTAMGALFRISKVPQGESRAIRVRSVIGLPNSEPASRHSTRYWPSMLTTN